MYRLNVILRHPRAHLRRAVAFTFIELLIVMALGITLMAIAIPMYSSYVQEARLMKAIVDINLIENALNAYERDNGSLPEALESIAQYLEIDTPDPWGEQYRYLLIAGVKNPVGVRKDKFLVPLNNDYDLYSMGKDRLTQTPLTAAKALDDIIRAADGQYVGLASGF